MQKNIRVFMDVEINGIDAGRVEFELFSRDLPQTTENFRALCTGEMGKCKSDKTKDLHFMGSYFHRVIPGFMLQGGDITLGDGRGGESIYGTRFADEAFKYTHREYVLSMANSGRNTNGSQFFITAAECQHLDGKHVVFGKVVKGIEVVKRIEALGTTSGKPTGKAQIVACGEFREQ